MPFYIYKITNNINKKVYVGQTSRSVERRFREHCSVKATKYSMLSRAINKYGSSHFKIEILAEFETATQEALNDIETWCIKHFNCLTPKGYNICPIGNRAPGITKEHPRYDEIVEQRTNAVIETWKGFTEEEKKEKQKGLHIYKCQQKFKDHETRINQYLPHLNRYKLHNFEGKPSVCTYGLDAASEFTGVSERNLGSRCEPANIMFGKVKDGWSIRDVDLETDVKPQYLPNATHYELTDPTGRSYCKYGLEGIQEETGLQREGLTALCDPNNRRYGRKLKGWSIRKLDTPPEEQILIDELQAKKKAQVAANNAERAKSNGLKNSKKYLVTTPDNLNYCVIGLTHLTELGLDPSGLSKVARGILKQYKGYRLELIAA